MVETEGPNWKSRLRDWKNRRFRRKAELQSIADKVDGAVQPEVLESLAAAGPPPPEADASAAPPPPPEADLSAAPPPPPEADASAALPPPPGIEPGAGEVPAPLVPEEPAAGASAAPPAPAPEPATAVAPPVRHWYDAPAERFKGLTARVKEETLRIAEDPYIVVQRITPLAERAAKLFQKQGMAVYGTAATIAMSTYFLADLPALLLERYIPSAPDTSMPSDSGPPASKSLASYDAVFGRNLFNSKGLIPGEGAVEEGGGYEEAEYGGPATKTTLALDLLGTMIFVNPAKSIATILDRSASRSYPLRVDDEISGKILVTRIEARRVTFKNLKARKLEFVELPEEEGAQPLVKSAPAGKPIERVSSTQFQISRSEVDDSLSDLNRVLTQARAVPHFENGLPAGYKLFQIVPGSIFDKLGFTNGDVIAAVNGESINDPSKAFELLNGLKESNHVEIGVKRNGRDQTLVYDITP